MSIIPRNCKFVNKQNALPELFNLRFIESQYPSDPQLQAIIEMIKRKDPEIHTKITAMSKFYAQYTQDFHVKDGCLWMDERLVIPNTLQQQTALLPPWEVEYVRGGKRHLVAVYGPCATEVEKKEVLRADLEQNVSLCLHNSFCRNREQKVNVDLLPCCKPRLLEQESWDTARNSMDMLEKVLEDSDAEHQDGEAME